MSDPNIRVPYSDFSQDSITLALAVENLVGPKRGRLKHLMIHNYGPARGTPRVPAAAN